MRKLFGLEEFKPGMLICFHEAPWVYRLVTSVDKKERVYCYVNVPLPGLHVRTEQHIENIDCFDDPTRSSIRTYVYEGVYKKAIEVRAEVLLSKIGKLARK